MDISYPALFLRRCNAKSLPGRISRGRYENSIVVWNNTYVFGQISSCRINGMICIAHQHGSIAIQQ